MDRKLQSTIQIFIRIACRSIGRQEEYVNFLGVFLQPGRNKFAVVDFKIIQDQEHFPLRGANQTIHKLDESVLVHRFLIKHKTNIALTADCRDHIDPLPFRLYWQNGRVTLGREASL